MLHWDYNATVQVKKVALRQKYLRKKCRVGSSPNCLHPADPYTISENQNLSIDGCYVLLERRILKGYHYKRVGRAVLEPQNQLIDAFYVSLAPEA